MMNYIAGLIRRMTLLKYNANGAYNENKLVAETVKAHFLVFVALTGTLYKGGRSMQRK